MNDSTGPTPPTPDDLLLQRVLDDRCGSVHTSNGEDDAEARAAHERFLDATRERLQTSEDWSALRESALIGRILARTTHEDLSWRGDFGLVFGFVRRRLQDSPLLRAVAALLVLQLFVLPVLGYMAYRDSQSAARITFDVPFENGEQDLFDPDVEPPADVVLPEDDTQTVARERMENARRRARYLLTRHGGPVVHAAGASDPMKIRLLAARSQGLETGRWADWLEDAQALSAADEVERALWVECLLDVYVLTQERSPEIGPALNQLALTERSWTDAEAGTQPSASRTLIQAALDRARAYGLWEAPAGFDPQAIGDPLDPVWLAALRQAFESPAERDHPIASGWLNWSR